jgi:ABC-type nitrate/sulfonate/bicarbonate transport system substrate-binding protein
LQGKVISAQTGTNLEYFAISALTFAGSTPSTVTIDNLRPINVLAALASGSVAAAVLPEPHVSLEKLSGATVLTIAHAFVNGYGFLDVARSALKTLESQRRSATIVNWARQNAPS